VRFATKANTAVRRWGSRGGVRRHGRVSPVLEHVHGGARAVVCQGRNVCAACARGGALRKRTHVAGGGTRAGTCLARLMAVAAASGAATPCCARVRVKAGVDGRDMQDIKKAQRWGFGLQSSPTGLTPVIRVVQAEQRRAPVACRFKANSISLAPTRGRAVWAAAMRSSPPIWQKRGRQQLEDWLGKKPTGMEGEGRAFGLCSPGLNGDDRTPEAEWLGDGVVMAKARCRRNRTAAAWCCYYVAATPWLAPS
jgi:hypothetical protein